MVRTAEKLVPEKELEAILIELCGEVVSKVISLLEPREFANPGAANVNAASFPEESLIVAQAGNKRAAVDE